MYRNLCKCYVFLAVFLSAAFVQADWSSPQAVSSVGQIAIAPQIATDPSGNIVAIWYSYDGSNYAVFAASQMAGGAWTSPVRLSAAGQDAYLPTLSVDELGNAVGIWFHYDGARYAIQASSLPLGGNWSASIDISSSGVDAYDPQVSTDSLGNAVAVWFQFDGSYYSVQSASLPRGGSWTSPATLSSVGVDGITPVIGVDGLGNAYAAWNEFDGVNYSIQFSSLPFRGSWTSATQLSIEGTNAYEPQITIDSSGDVAVGWYYDDGANYIVQVALQPFRGSWSAPFNLSGAGEDACTPILRTDSDGNITAVWQRYNGSNYIIQSAYLSFEGSWSSPQDLSPIGQDSYNPGIAVNSAGDSVAIWYVYDGSSYVVQAATRAAGADWNTAANLSNPSDNVDQPQAVIDLNGDVFVIWQDNTSWSIVEVEGTSLFVSL